MDHVVCVRMGCGCSNPHAQKRGFLLSDHPIPNVLVQPSAMHQLHHHGWLITTKNDFVNSYDSRVARSPKGRALLQQSLLFIDRCRALQYLDGNWSIKHAIDRFPDTSHTAGTQLSHDLKSGWQDWWNRDLCATFGECCAGCRRCRRCRRCLAGRCRLGGRRSFVGLAKQLQPVRSRSSAQCGLQPLPTGGPLRQVSFEVFSEQVIVGPADVILDEMLKFTKGASVHGGASHDVVLEA
jgi:hypothetical protein